MNKLSKTTVLALCLLATSTQTTQCVSSGWQVFITFLFGDSQPQSQNSSDQAPAGVTVEDYITQFRYDLNGSVDQNRNPVIPWDEVKEMEATIKEELRFTNLRDKETVNNKIRSILLNHVKTKTISDLKQLTHDGFYLTSDDYTRISNSNENNMLARLSQIPHLNGEAIAQYFGAARKNTLRDILNNRQNF